MTKIPGIYSLLFITLLLNVSNSQEEASPDLLMTLPVEGEYAWIYWDQLLQDPFIKDHLDWDLAICQHPMYLLIDEDRGIPVVGERIPPWGATTAEGYVERVQRNLASLEAIPELRLNYQWSALEIEDVASRFPKVYDRMLTNYNSGSLDFIDGTYSQAHLQVLGSESNWRQFEYGLAVYEKLFKMKPGLYARQETGIHLQLPQLLRLFGYRYMMVPAFTSTIEFSGDAPIELLNLGGRYQPINDQEFINAVGLDGSEIPLYLFSEGYDPPDFAEEFQQDMYGAPKIWIEFPDLKEIDQEDFDEYNSTFDLVLLRDALDEQFTAAPPVARGKIYSYWSYLEGVWAEELMRSNKAAEETAVMTEALAAMAHLAGKDVEKSDQLHDIWHSILKAQHHDISWIEVTDLRRKSIDRMLAVEEKCKDIMAEVAATLVEPEDRSWTVFNWLPWERKALLELPANTTLSGSAPFQQITDRTIGFVELPAGGFTSFRTSNTPASSTIADLPDVIATANYSVTLSPSGLIEQITTTKGKSLLAHGDYLGGEIRARIDKEWFDNRHAHLTFQTGPVCDVLIRETGLGSIPIKETYLFFKDQSLIQVDLEFEFNGDSVGYMWLDETKINVYYPTAGLRPIHDIPFGYVESRRNRPLFALNWLYSGGLVYVNRGTIKHWTTDDGLIANVIAWGAEHFSNRLHWDWLDYRQFDLKLYGKHKIQYYLLIYDTFDGARIVRDVADITTPKYQYPGRGEKSFYSNGKQKIAATGLYVKDNQVYMRGYQLPGQRRAKYKNWQILNVELDAR